VRQGIKGLILAAAGALAFAGAAHATSPTVTVTPNSDLAPSQLVSISAVGFGANEVVQFSQCDTSATHCKFLTSSTTSPSGPSELEPAPAVM